jgi:hypothetical protein
MTIYKGNILLLAFALTDDDGAEITDVSGYEISLTLELDGSVVRSWSNADLSPLYDGSMAVIVRATETVSMATGDYDVKLQVDDLTATVAGAVTIEEEETPA